MMPAMPEGEREPPDAAVRKPPLEGAVREVTRELRGFGGYPAVHARERCGASLERISEGVTLSRGLGRAYGDAALPPDGESVVATTTRADHLLGFDARTGILRAQAGVSLRDLNRAFLPRGWFTPVSPGTAFVTLGGMVAADVHGKNHHVAGTFGEHVTALRMRVGDGQILEVTEQTEPALFRATLGGMGLTGHILEVEFRMQRVPSPWLYETRTKVRNIDELIPRLGEVSRDWPMTVAWLDTSARGAALGRGSLWMGRWAEADEAPAHAPTPGETRLAVPFPLPNGLVGRSTLRLANSVWYRWQSLRQGSRITDPQHFFYPLDGIADWPRVYGRRGFTQYQCVLPSDPRVFRQLLELFQRLGEASFVTVVKDCGDEGRGLISFPKPGTSIALDIPIAGPGARHSTQQLIDELNVFTLAHGGRIYLAKDAFTRAEHFRAMYPRLDEWSRIRRKWDPEGRLRSALAVRLLGDDA